MIALTAIDSALAMAPPELAASAPQVPLLKQSHDLVVGSEQDFPPFSTGMTDETAGGFTVDLWKAVAAESGLKYTLRVRPFHQLLQEFRDGQVDVLINLAMSDERHKFADFTVPHVTVHGAIFTRSDDFKVASEADLTGKSVIVLRADLAHDYALAKGWGPGLVLVDTAAEGFRLLATGRHDVMLLSKLTGLQTLQKLELNSIKALPIPIGFSQKFAFATQSRQPDLLAQINDGLALTKANGLYNTLYERWFGLYEVKEVSLRDLLKYLGPVVALFVILLGYLFYRRQVERNLAHAAVAQSRNLLLAIIDTAPVRVYWKDKNLRYLGCNAAFAKDAGMDHPKDVIGKDDFQMGWAAQAEQMHRDDMAIMESGFARLFYDEPQMTPAGTTRWLRMSKVLLVDKNKEVIGLLGVYEDTTQQKEMEQALLVSNNLMRNILDNIPVGLSAFDKDLKLIAHNRLFQETLDFPDALVCEAGTSFEKIIRFNAERGEYGAGDPDQLVRTVIERARRPQLHQFERVRPNGVTLEVRGAPMPGGGFVTTYADISERKRVEGVERRLTAQLRLDEERAHDFSLSASDWFWETDAEHRFCFFSSSFEQIYGLSTDLWIGKSRREILAMDRFNPMETVKAHLAQLDERQPFKNFEYQVRRTDGIVIWVSVSGLPHFDVNGDFAGYRGTGTLISERKAIEESLRQAVQQAQAATLTKSRFLTTMSHEIRTPMNGILGMAQLLLMPDLTESQRRSYARTILSSGQALLTLLNDILDLSKIEAGKLQLDSTVFEPNALLRETWTLFSGVVQAKGLQMAFEWQGADDQRYVADSNRLRQMLSNLVGNAIKFTSEGRVRMEGREIERAGDSAILEFSVSDTGIGIPAEKIDLLFKPFSQTDSSMTRQFGGTGLGLSIVLNLAKAMGGEVGVESVAGEGSRFWFRLRAKPVSVGDESRRIERPQQDTGTSVVPLTPLARPDVRVLVVEDNPVNCKVIELFLRKLGVSATLLTDGQQALDAITQGDRYDLVLMDLHMPVMDGYAATERIRQWESDLQRPRLPILALTADAFEEDRLHCLAAGMDDVLTKPINLDVLKSSLTRWLPTAAGGVLPGKIASTPAVRKVDRALFLAQIEELRPLLERNMFDSIVRFEELQTLVSGTDIAAEVNEIAALLAQLSFDAALARLSLLAQSQSGNRGA